MSLFEAISSFSAEIPGFSKYIHSFIFLQILLHCAGIVLLTLLVNGTTIGKLLYFLGENFDIFHKRS